MPSTETRLLSNAITRMEYTPDDRTFKVSGRDMRDMNNEPSCFNKTKRSHKKAWAALVAAWNDKTTMYDACEILSDNGLRMHTYCAVD